MSMYIYIHTRISWLDQSAKALAILMEKQKWSQYRNENEETWQENIAGFKHTASLQLVKNIVSSLINMHNLTYVYIWLIRLITHLVTLTIGCFFIEKTANFRKPRESIFKTPCTSVEMTNFELICVFLAGKWFLAKIKFIFVISMSELTIND